MLVDVVYVSEVFLLFEIKCYMFYGFKVLQFQIDCQNQMLRLSKANTVVRVPMRMYMNVIMCVTINDRLSTDIR